MEMVSVSSHSCFGASIRTLKPGVPQPAWFRDQPTSDDVYIFRLTLNDMLTYVFCGEVHITHWIASGYYVVEPVAEATKLRWSI
jgi:hypothetical protein